MAIATTGKALLWALGGLLALGCGGMILLYGAAGLAMWGNARSLEQDAARREAAYRAMTPEQHLAQAKEALERAHDARLCLGFLQAVPEGTPGRAELQEKAMRQRKAEDDARAAMEAMTPEQHLAAAQAALDAGDLPGCRGHLYFVPRATPGCEALMAAAARKEKALEAAGKG